MQKYIHMMILFAGFSVCAGNEFIKKPKVKKESVAQVKEEIAELLESVLRQVGQNICQSIDVQNNVFDKIKEIMSDNQLSCEQLKSLRTRLEKQLKILEEQQAQLYDIILSCSKS